MAEKDRKSSKNLKILFSIFQFISPYKLQVTLAGISLVFTAAISLSMGQGFRLLIDEGFALGSTEQQKIP